MNSIIEKTSAALIISFVTLLFATLGFAGGPILNHSPGVPFVWGLGTFTTLPGGVPYLKDMGNLNPVLVTKAQADSLTDLTMTEISAVATSIMTLTAAGDIPMDITGANVLAYVNTFHGPGIDVIYDEDGSVMAAFGAPGALGLGGITFTDAVTPEIAAGFAIMNGPTVAAGDVGGTFFRIVFTQEVSHALNLHHDQTNGAISFFGDNTAPGGTFGAPVCPSLGGTPAFADFTALYPFADISVGGPGAAAGSFDHLEDLSSLSRIYPTGTYAATTGTIVGTVFATDGVTPVNGVNVIARNTADPFGDARSAITGDQEFMPGDGFAGTYLLTGLTPGATYTLAIDNQAGGAFPQPPPASFIEEYWNGASESADPAIDDPCDFTTILVAAGATATASIIFNEPPPGVITLSDDDFAAVELPFSFPFCGTGFDTVFIGSNGYLTFGGGDTDFLETVSALLAGLPRIAALWDDLDPSAGGTVTAIDTSGNFVITFDSVPEFSTTNSNSFTYTLRPDGTYDIDYPTIAATDGLAGRSEGGGATDPGEVDLTAQVEPIGVGVETIYEIFTAADNDLSGETLEFGACSLTTPLITVTSPNGGENWQVGSSQNITWTSSGTSGLVDIDLSTDGGASFSPIFSNISDDGLESWTVLNTPSSNCFIRITDDDGIPSDTSDAVFTIFEAPITSFCSNGSFETGDFTDWVTQDLSSPFFPLTVGGSGISPGFGLFTSAPTNGVFAALHGFDGNGPGTIRIAQDVTVPGGAGSLEFDYRGGWDLLTFGATLNRTFSVNIEPAGGGTPLQTDLILTAPAGNFTGDTGPLHGSVDISAFVGMTVRISFDWDVPESSSGPAFFQLDNVICVSDSMHFSPVAPTGDPRPVVIQNATIDSLPIVSGDEIGVFDDTLCVGAGSFSGTYPLTITIWMEVSLPGGGVLPGATAGNSMSFKMWQLSSDTELPGTPTYTTGSGIFGEALTVVNPLSGTTDVTQTIPVKAGLINLISFNVLPPDLAVDVVLDDLDSLLVAQDDQGQFYIPPFSVNTIGNIDITNGYQVFITGAADDSVMNDGQPLVPEDYSQSLSNTQLFMIDYPYQLPHPVEDVFAAIDSSVGVVQDDLGQFWIPAFAVNTIGNMQPGKGYQIFVNQPVNFTYPAASTLPLSKTKAIPTAALSAPKYFDYQHTGLPYGVLVTSSEQGLKSGDEIAVFDGDLCVGAAVFTGEYPLAIAAWEGHEEYGLTGFKTGNEIVLRVWKSSEQLEMNAVVSFANSDESTFHGGPISVLSISSLPGLESIPLTFALDQNYPNPFNPETTIRYHLPEDSKVILTVYNLAGQAIRALESDHRAAGSHEVIWDSRNDKGRQVAGGVYFYRFQAGDFTAVKKLVLIK